MKIAKLYWDECSDYSTVIVEDEKGNRSFEREVYKGDDGMGWFCSWKEDEEFEEELQEYLAQEEVDYDQLKIA